MGFNNLIAKAGTLSFARFSNCDVSIMLSGTMVLSIRGIHDRFSETVNLYESAIDTYRPVLTVLESDTAGIDSDYVLLVKVDGETISTEYKYTGQPQPDGAGLSILTLTTDF